MSEAAWLIKETLAKQRALEALHTKERHTTYAVCKECLQPFPCATRKILKGDTK